jgi:hypothetical protein
MKILLIAVALCVSSTRIEPPQLPQVSAQDLNKKKLEWPKDFTADRTLLLVAFGRKQQVFIDGWVAGLDLKKANAPAWFEVPLINNPGSIVRGFIDSGMRKGIPSVADRAHVVTLYVKKKAFMQSMALPNENVHAVVVDKSGKVMLRVTGGFSAAGAEQVKAALGR